MKTYNSCRLRYPSVFILLGEIPVIALGALILIGYMDEKTLYCPTMDFNDGFNDPSLYCRFANGT